MESFSNAKKQSGGLEFNPESFAIVIGDDSDTPDSAPVNRNDSSKAKPQSSNPEPLAAANVEKFVRQSSKPQQENHLLEKLSGAINPEMWERAQKILLNGKTGPSNNSNPATPISQKNAGIQQNTGKFQTEDFKKIKSQLLNKADMDKPQSQKTLFPDAKKQADKAKPEIVILDEDESDDEKPQKAQIPVSSASNQRHDSKEMKNGDDKRQNLSSKIMSNSSIPERMLQRTSSVPNETAGVSSGNIGTKAKIMKEDSNEQRPQKKPAGTRVRLEDKIQNLQGIQGSTQPLNPLDPLQNAAHSQKAMGDFSNLSLANPLLGFGPQLDQAALMKNYLTMMQYQKNYNPLALQMLLNPALNPAASYLLTPAANPLLNPELLRVMQLAQQSALQQQQSQLNPLHLGTAQEMSSSKSEQEKLAHEKSAQAKSQPVKENITKEKNTEEIKSAEVIHIVDDETDKEEFKPQAQQLKAKSLLSKNNVEMLAAADKSKSQIFQIRQQKPTTRQQNSEKMAEGSEMRPEMRTNRRERQTETEGNGKEVKKPRTQLKQTDKKTPKPQNP